MCVRVCLCVCVCVGGRFCAEEEVGEDFGREACHVGTGTVRLVGLCLTLSCCDLLSSCDDGMVVISFFQPFLCFFFSVAKYIVV